MKKRRGSFLQRMLAVLLSTVLVTGMVSKAAPMTVRAQEHTDPFEEVGSEPQDSVSENADETVTEGVDDGTGQETPEPGMKEETEEGQLEPDAEEATEPETIGTNEIETEVVAEPQGVLLAAEPAPQAEITAGSENEGWILYDDGSLTITSDAGMSGWKNQRLTYGGGVISAEIQNGVVSIVDYAFDGCKSLTNITIPESVTSIGTAAFQYCEGLTEITIPGGVTSIGSSAFNYCSGLTEITIPSGVTSIGNGAFQFCSGLTEIMIPSGITSIGNYTFNGCSGLTSITISEKVTSIGSYAFYNCSNLTEVTMKGGIPPTLGELVFYDCGFATDKDDTTGIHVPGGKAQAYKTAWTDWAAYITDGTPTGITDFAQFKEAVSKGGTVTIAQDVTLTDTVTVDKDVTILSDGTHTIFRGEKCNASMFTVSAGTLTLGGGNGTLILDGGAVWSGGADATLNRGRENTGIHAWDSMIHGEGGNIVLKGNTVLQNNDCDRNGHGGAVTLQGSSLTIEGAKICGNESLEGGGAVKTYKGSSVVMKGGEICQNEAGTHGGAFQIYGSEPGNQASHSEVPCQISGGEIHNNLASGVGGGIAVSNHSAVELSGNLIISDNKTTDASRRGGGVGFTDKDTSLTVSGQVQIKDNLCGNKGNNLAVGTNGNNLITINGSKPLSGSANIGITTIEAPTKEKTVNVTGANSADQSKCFTSDDQNYAIADSADHTVKLILPKSDFDKLVETIEVVMAALNDYTVTNDTTQQSIQDVIDAALNDAGIADAKVEVRDFQKIKATTEAEGSIRAKIYAECGTKNHTGDLTAKIDKVSATHTHDLTLTPTKSATCTEAGNTAYYVCGGNGGCGKWFSDAAGTKEITDKDSVVIPKTGHGYDEATWGYAGADGHAHKCQNCNAHDIVRAHTPGAAATATTPQTCTACGYEIAPATGTEPGTGTVTPEVKPGANAPATSISTPAAELEDVLLTEGEKQQVQNGTDIKIVLEVQDAGSSASKADKDVVEAALGGGAPAQGFTVGQYLNIELYKLIGTNRTDVTETAKKIRIVLTVPEGLKNKDSGRTRTFVVIRVHDGKADLLSDVDDDADTITIETDRFSTYAIAYQDVAGSGGQGDGGQGGSGNDGQGGSGKDSSTPEADGNDKMPNPARDNEPKTGDAANVELYATLAMIFGFTWLFLYVTDKERGMTEETKKELVSRMVAWAKRGGRLRRYAALAAIFCLLAYYHSMGKRLCMEWKEVYGK